MLSRKSGWLIGGALINVVEQEVEHLRGLDADQSGDIEPSNVHGVLSRVWGVRSQSL